MRCRNHSADFSSAVGVCASCLRERLFSIIAAQAQAQAQSRRHERCWKSDHDPPPLVFPRSVSPYVCHREYDEATSATDYYGRCDDRQHRYNLFFSTPQVGPNYRATPTFTTGSCDKKQRSVSSFWSRLFRFRSDKLESDSKGLSKELYEPTSTSSSNSSWFSSIFSGRRKKQPKQHFSEGVSVATVNRRPCRTVDRGMSPARAANSDDDCDDQCGQSPAASGYSSESSQKWRQSPALHLGLARKVRQTPNRNISDLVFCLSPLVRANPNKNWRQKGLAPEIRSTGENRNPAKPHLSTAASFCGNRSRKIADFGRVNPNR